MSLNSTFSTREPQENKDNYQKELIGDTVAQVTEFIEIESNKDKKKWLVLKCEAIHPIEDKKGRETTIDPGDEISVFYDPSDDQSAEKLQDDLFTAGIEVVNAETEKDLIANIASAAKDKLIYFRCYMGKKFKKVGNEFVEVEGEISQKIKIKSANLINDENSQPVLPF